METCTENKHKPKFVMCQCKAAAIVESEERRGETIGILTSERDELKSKLLDKETAWGLMKEAHQELLEEHRELKRRLEPSNERDASGRRFADWIESKREWSEKTFGRGRRTEGVCRHIEKELEEVRNDPTDVIEWADVILLAIDGARRAGHTGNDIWWAMRSKQMTNEARSWPMPSGDDNPIHHVEIERRDDAIAALKYALPTYWNPRAELPLFSDRVKKALNALWVSAFMLGALLLIAILAGKVKP